MFAGTYIDTVERIWFIRHMSKLNENLEYRKFIGSGNLSLSVPYVWSERTISLHFSRDWHFSSSDLNDE
jgi:hypothetical protein